MLEFICNKRLKFRECTVQVRTRIARKLLQLWVQKRGFIESLYLCVYPEQVFLDSRLDV